MPFAYFYSSGAGDEGFVSLVNLGGRPEVNLAVNFFVPFRPFEPLELSSKGFEFLLTILFSDGN